MCEVTCVSEHTTFFILFSSGVSSSETCFISLESFSKFLKHDTHTNEFESVIDTVQRGNLWCANSVSTGTTCWEAGLARLRLLGKRRLQALHSGCEAEISLERSGVHTATCAQPLILHFCITITRRHCQIYLDAIFPTLPRFPPCMGKIRLVRETTTHACVHVL